MHYAIILAAGASRRMGVDKASLPWGKDHTLLSYQVAQWHQAGVRAIAVVNCHNQQLAQLPALWRVVVNPNPELGKTYSIRLGLQALPAKFSSVTISAVDQPRPAQVYQQMIAAQATSGKAVIAPRRGHPLLFAARLLPDLMEISEESLGLRRVMHQHYLEIVHVDIGDALMDINTPEDYQKFQSQSRLPASDGS